MQGRVEGLPEAGLLAVGVAACSSWRRLEEAAAVGEAGRSKMLPYTVKLTGQDSAKDINVRCTA